ncbi:uncharacterized protein LOC129737611 [Uranotaenia lowii]|uniref:uncharacterized protein LOC129737611 n=1 Tax=Uranotaenia lowii TaxID=190385 RepID=UPI002479A7B2|nr:uncharacterized protein LOC129737611 [Uranotaenia lowii]
MTDIEIDQLMKQEETTVHNIRTTSTSNTICNSIGTSDGIGTGNTIRITSKGIGTSNGIGLAGSGADGLECPCKRSRSGGGRYGGGEQWHGSGNANRDTSNTGNDGHYSSHSKHHTSNRNTGTGSSNNSNWCQRNSSSSHRKSDSSQFQNETSVPLGSPRPALEMDLKHQLPPVSAIDFDEPSLQSVEITSTQERKQPIEGSKTGAVSGVLIGHQTVSQAGGFRDFQMWSKLKLLRTSGMIPGRRVKRKCPLRRRN